MHIVGADQYRNSPDSADYAYNMPLDKAKAACIQQTRQFLSGEKDSSNTAYTQCAGLDFNADDQRVYFGTTACHAQVDNEDAGKNDRLQPDAHYKHHNLAVTNERRLSGQYVGSSNPVSGFSDFTVNDFGFSLSEMLRFSSLTFTSGGRYRLCVCLASQAGGSGAPCSSLADYKFEVGTVHSSGLSCMLNDPKFRRHSCTKMYQYSADQEPGLRCHRGDSPTFTADHLVIDKLFVWSSAEFR